MISFSIIICVYLWFVSVFVLRPCWKASELYNKLSHIGGRVPPPPRWNQKICQEIGDEESAESYLEIDDDKQAETVREIDSVGQRGVLGDCQEDGWWQAKESSQDDEEIAENVGFMDGRLRAESDPL